MQAALLAGHIGLGVLPLLLRYGAAYLRLLLNCGCEFVFNFLDLYFTHTQPVCQGHLSDIYSRSFLTDLTPGNLAGNILFSTIFPHG